MKVTILGSGSFISDLNHFGPSYLVEHNGKKILVDAGQGAVIQLLKLGINPEDLDYILITHFHADHVLDLAALIISRKIASRWKELNGKLTIVGQKGTGEKVKEILAAFCDSAPEFYDVIENEEVEIDGLSIRSYKVIHKDLDAVCFRLELNGKNIVFSGDCVMCDGIIEASKNADVLIIDASLPKTMENNIHINSEQIGKLCAENDVKKVVLSHLTHWVKGIDIVSEVRENFDGEVELAKDLMEIEV